MERIRQESGNDSVGRRTFLAGSAGVVATSAFSLGRDRPPDVLERDAKPVLAAGLNGRPHRLLDDLDLLDVSETTWVRAFVDVREKLATDTRPADDPDVLALRRAAQRNDCKIVLSLKWDFTGSSGHTSEISVPKPGSPRERALFRTAARYVASLGDSVDVIVLGNEPLWETLESDLRGRDPPIVEFTRRAKEHLLEHLAGDPAFIVGAFNRLDDVVIRAVQYRSFHDRMFELIRRDDEIAGADLHVHFDQLAEANGMLSVARSKLPDSLLTVSEFSPVWRYDRHKHAPIDRSDAGARFAERYGIARGTTTVEYVERSKADPRSPEEMADFMTAMPWYNEDHVADVYGLLETYDVRLGALGFLQHVGMRNEDWTTGWTPFHLNFLFQRALIASEHGSHPYYLRDYRRRTGEQSATLE